MSNISLLEQAFTETGEQLDRIIDAYERIAPTPPGPSIPYGIKRSNGTIITDSLPIAFGLAPEPGWQTILQQQQQSQLTIQDRDNRQWIFDPSGNNGQYNGIVVKTMTYMQEVVAWIDYSTLAITVLNQEYSIEWI